MYPRRSSSSRWAGGLLVVPRTEPRAELLAVAVDILSVLRRGEAGGRAEGGGFGDELLGRVVWDEPRLV